MGGCQNYGPHLGPLNTRCRITLRDHNFDNQPYTHIHMPIFQKAVRAYIYIYCNIRVVFGHITCMLNRIACKVRVIIAWLSDLTVPLRLACDERQAMTAKCLYSGLIFSVFRGCGTLQFKLLNIHIYIYMRMNSFRA